VAVVRPGRGHLESLRVTAGGGDLPDAWGALAILGTPVGSCDPEFVMDYGMAGLFGGGLPPRAKSMSG
jgi:hypothetical protein